MISFVCIKQFAQRISAMKDWERALKARVDALFDRGGFIWHNPNGTVEYIEPQQKPVRQRAYRPRPEARRPLSERDRSLVDAWNGGATVRELAEQYAVSASRIHQITKRAVRMGVDVRTGRVSTAATDVRQCSVCGTEVGKYKRYCDTCRPARHTYTKACPSCNQEYQTPFLHQVHCSRSCARRKKD